MAAEAANRPSLVWVNSVTPRRRGNRAETWLALIHGANGIEYFCHILSPSFLEAGCLTVVAHMRTDDAQVGSLAPVLDSDSVADGVRVASSVRVDTMVKSCGGATYVFADAGDPTGGSASIRLPGARSGSVTVVGENRSLTLNGGTFTDTFSGYGVHIYEIAAG